MLPAIAMLPCEITMFLRVVQNKNNIQIGRKKYIRKKEKDRRMKRHVFSSVPFTSQVNGSWEPLFGRTLKSRRRRDFRPARVALLLAKVFVIRGEINCKRVIDCATRRAASLCTRFERSTIYSSILVPFFSHLSFSLLFSFFLFFPCIIHVAKETLWRQEKKLRYPSMRKC